MFVDRISIKLIAGDGGDGMAAFRREANVPLGGPYGGDGGNGGNVVFKATSSKSTLLELRYNRIVKAERGENGKTKKMHGRTGKDFEILVPLGTMIKNSETNLVIADLTEEGQTIIIAHGGRGGRGNARFATPRNPAPQQAERGMQGDKLDVTLELKVLADVGLVGFPSVGKSTLLSVISRAKPEIADYHFTTLAPNLGISSSDDGRTFTVADLPGLIEEAHTGKGLGHVFLRHIERCRVLVHVLDMGSEEGRDPLEDFKIINKELELYNANLLERPMIIAANKMDLDAAEENLKRFKEAYPEYEVFELITVVGEGTKALLYRLADILDSIPKESLKREEDTVVFKYEKPREKFSIVRHDGNMWELTGEVVVRLLDQYDFEYEDEVIQFGMALKRLGVDEALRAAGATHGDVVILESIQFVFDEGVLD
ncbi:MAG: GTPase ObgE [Erysipelothrix sp.]|nr:GTPase ObgE [Erysipelothrix sp.]